MNIIGLGAFLLAIFLGSVTQRLTGLGFAMVATPLLVFAMGAWDAVGLLIVAGSFSAAGTMWLARQHIDWRKAAVLSVSALAGAIPGTWVLITTPRRTIELVIGFALLVALVVTALVPSGAMRDRSRLSVVTGFASGFATASVALGGVPLVAYARLSAWHPTIFAATIQPVFVALVAPLITLRAVFGDQPLPSLTLPELLLAAGMLVAGLAVGQLLSHRLSPALAFRMVMVIAFAGALATLVRASTYS